MGFDSGTISFQRFAVLGQAPASVDQDLLDKVATHALLLGEDWPIEAVEYGWSGCRHIDDRHFTFANCVYADCLYVALRIDTRKVPPEMVKAMTQTAEDAAAALNPSGFISKNQKREIKDQVRRQVDDEIRSGKHRRSKLVPILWDVPAGVVYGPTSASVTEKLYELFDCTFGLTLSPMTSGQVAERIAGDKGVRRAYEDARPTQFTAAPMGGEMFPEYGWCAKGPQPKDFLGNEWMLLTWFNSSEADGEVSDPTGGRGRLHVLGGLRLECAWSYGGRDVMNGEIANMPECREALRSGKVPREAGTLLLLGNEFQMKLKAETLAVTGLKLPEVEDAETVRVLFEERIAYLREFCKTLDGLYEAFVDLRLSPKWDGVAKKIRTWIESRRTGETVGQAAGRAFNQKELERHQQNHPSDPTGLEALQEAMSDSKKNVDRITEILASDPKLANAAELMVKMMDRRDQTKQYLGKKYAELVAMASKDIAAEMKKSGEAMLPCVLRMAKYALEEEGNYWKQNLYVAAAVEMHEAGLDDADALQRETADITGVVNVTLDKIATAHGLTPEQARQPIPPTGDDVRECDAREVVRLRPRSRLWIDVAPRRTELWCWRFGCAAGGAVPQAYESPWTGHETSLADALTAVFTAVKAKVAEFVELDADDSHIDQILAAVDEAAKGQASIQQAA